MVWILNRQSDVLICAPWWACALEYNSGIAFLVDAQSRESKKKKMKFFWWKGAHGERREGKDPQILKVILT